jgi:PhnB protein
MAKKKSSRKKAKKAAKKPAARKTVKKAAPKKAAKKAVKKTEPRHTKINSYINFDGNCEQAFDFYKEVFGGKFSWKGKFKEMPVQDGSQPVSGPMGERIMHVALPISKETALMGSDTMPGMGPPFVFGNNFTISVDAGTRAQADRYFHKLSYEGKVNMPMADQFWGAYWGTCTDKFGVNWMISFSTQNN